MEQSIRFYRDLLGFQVQYESEHWSTLLIDGVRIGLHPRFEDHGPQGGGWVSCLETSNLVGLRNLLTSNGVHCSEFHETPGGVLFNFQDPDNNRLQAIQPGTTVESLTS